MSSEIAISIHNVSKRFEMYARPRDRLLQFFSAGKREYFKEFWALHNISFEVARGETVAIMGTNGSGKSTLLQIIAGTLTPSMGEIRCNGRLAALLELGSGFNPEFTGRENVYLNGAVLGMSREEMAARFDSIERFADIGDHIDQPVKTYSSGMYVRLAFAVQACVEPQILIVDEALSVGDEKFQRKCFEYIERLRANGSSILMVTHSTSTVEKFCQRAVLLHKGEIHGIGSAKTIIDQYHALLYSDEQAYLRYVHSQNPDQPPQDMANASTLHRGLRAVITDWQTLTLDGVASETYTSGDRLKVRFAVDILDHIAAIQAGVLIRTVEGVTAFGTSTMYHGKNVVDAHAGQTVQFEFDIALALCSGSYFITLAIAEAISEHDMRYLDRKTDAMVVKISPTHAMGSGIAALDATITVTDITTP